MNTNQPDECEKAFLNIYRNDKKKYFSIEQGKKEYFEAGYQAATELSREGDQLSTVELKQELEARDINTVEFLLDKPWHDLWLENNNRGLEIERLTKENEELQQELAQCKAEIEELKRLMDGMQSL